MTEKRSIQLLVTQYGAKKVIAALVDLFEPTDYDVKTLQTRLGGTKCSESKKTEKRPTSLYSNKKLYEVFCEASVRERMGDSQSLHGSRRVAMESALILYLALPAARRHQIVNQWNQDHSYPGAKGVQSVWIDKTLMVIFEEQVYKEQLAKGKTRLQGIKTKAFTIAMTLYLAIPREERQRIVTGWKKERGREDLAYFRHHRLKK